MSPIAAHAAIIAEHRLQSRLHTPIGEFVSERGGGRERLAVVVQKKSEARIARRRRSTLAVGPCGLALPIAIEQFQSLTQ